MWRKEVHGQQHLDTMTWVGFVIMFFALYKTYFLLSFLGVFLVVTSRLGLYYLSKVGEGLLLEMERKTIHLFVHDETKYTVKISQQRSLPVLRATFHCKFEQVVRSKDHHSEWTNKDLEWKVPFTLAGKSAIYLDFPLSAVQRGTTRMRAIECHIPSFIGLGSVVLSYEPFVPQEVVVFPKLMPVHGLENLRHSNAVGEIESSFSLYADPLAPIGTRDYTYADSFRSIHWTASLKQQKLQTKRFEMVAQHSWAIVVNVRDREDSGYFHTIDRFEETLGFVAHITERATTMNIPYEIYINARLGNQGSVYHQELGSGREHLSRTLDMLARIRPSMVTLPASQLLQRVSQMKVTSPVMILCGDYNIEDIAFLSKARQLPKTFLLKDEGDHAHIVNIEKKVGS